MAETFGHNTSVVNQMRKNGVERQLITNYINFKSNSLQKMGKGYELASDLDGKFTNYDIVSWDLGDTYSDPRKEEVDNTPKEGYYFNLSKALGNQYRPNNNGEYKKINKIIDDSIINLSKGMLNNNITFFYKPHTSRHIPTNVIYTGDRYILSPAHIPIIENDQRKFKLNNDNTATVFAFLIEVGLTSPENIAINLNTRIAHEAILPKIKARLEPFANLIQDFQQVANTLKKGLGNER